MRTAAAMVAVALIVGFFGIVWAFHEMTEAQYPRCPEGTQLSLDNVAHSVPSLEGWRCREVTP